MLLNNKGSVVTGYALADEAQGYNKKTFVCKDKVVFVANDSTEGIGMLINFDSPIGAAGTFELKAGEVLSDYPISCKELYVQGINGTVPFRAVGV